jgi:hypothetical protein
MPPRSAKNAAIIGAAARRRLTQCIFAVFVYEVFNFDAKHNLQETMLFDAKIFY